ncbi:DUF2269 domain-containing protein [uncultured Pseudosulfitobacter sp.]|uniref:DUF2269 family protein n=1 Tax=uncultured Pseudosulfitobacter sp. TaxID=2854214 RepID=UPI0030DAA4E6|tara:strand:+ start:1306 stop:1770 length:465 start_codon:yes stop_codon:yes gene_type:complete
MDAYLTAKWLHILSSTVLFGTSIGTAFQMVWAMRSNNPVVIHRTASGVVVADWLFTTPAGLIQPLTGLWLIHLQGYPLTEPWLLLTYALYAVAFVAWVPVVGLQIRIRNLTAAATAVPDAARRAFRIWFALGWPAFLALIAIFWLMVHRPPLWG